MSRDITIEDMAQEIVDSLPARVRLEAETVRGMGERERWESGDLSAELCTELGDKYPATAIRLAVSTLYQLPETTIRDRERICKRVDHDERGRYPHLTFHLWRACVSTSANGQAEEYAAQVEAHLEAWGKLPRVEAVWGWISSDKKHACVPVWVSRLEGVIATLDKIHHDRNTPEQVSLAASEAQANLSKLLPTG